MHRLNTLMNRYSASLEGHPVHFLLDLIIIWLINVAVLLELSVHDAMHLW